MTAGIGTATGRGREKEEKCSVKAAEAGSFLQEN